MKQINCNILATQRFNPSSYTILIVEDSKSFNKILTTQFTKSGFVCLSAFNLAEAKDYLETNKVDYIMLDLNLPDGSGYELISTLKNSPIKIFVLTGETDTTIRENSFEKGIIDFIIKDQSFFHKIEQIENTISQLEKNKIQTILIASSNESLQNELTNIFLNRNYQVLNTFDSNETLSCIEAQQIDLILLDEKIGTWSGLEFLRKCTTSLHHFKKIPTMLLSSTIDTNIIRDGLKLGAVDILRKPYATEEIVLKTDRWIDYKRKEDELLCSTQFLKEYKNAIDRSSIVSKTDPKGIITYVNEQFCKISGYSEEELLGKPHNIIRHPDMSKDAFEWMWYTIKELKLPWEGEVKNLKKDGSHYWVKSTISPIVDSQGDITEYIGIRTDITHQKTVSNYFENQLGISEKNFCESKHLKQEHENAINQFTAILKTNTSNIITDANEYFCNLSQYTKEELIGLECSKLRHPNHILSNDCENIKKNLANKQSQKITFTNIAKDGSFYFLDTVIYPITCSSGEVVEHLHLMHNITELTNLHNEIETTQKEIVYKMGEIGESRSKETGNHVKRVAEYSKLLALLYGLSEEEADILSIVSPMHDIGKVGIPDHILKKPARLDKDEFEIMKSHAQIGYEILKESTRPILKAAAIVAHEHHERWDGKGYPRGLQGEDIHIYGRITAIADVFDALGSERCYKKAWNLDEILKLFEEEKNNQFDGKLIELFIENLAQFLEIRDRFLDLH